MCLKKGTTAVKRTRIAKGGGAELLSDVSSVDDKKEKRSKLDKGSGKRELVRGKA